MFVVDEWIEYNRENAELILKHKISRTYWDTLIEPLLISRSECEGGGDMYRLYFGATYNQPVNGMFSFFPCLLDNNVGGFARPIIRLDNVITDNLQQSFGYTSFQSINEVKSLCDDVVRQVNDQGLFLQYRYRGTDPFHRVNTGLREAMRKQVPLIYFHSIVPGKYLSVWPVYIIKDDPANGSSANYRIVYNVSHLVCT